MCQGGKSYATHPLKEENGDGLKMSAYMYTLKNVACFLLVPYYLLVFHYVFFVICLFEPAALHNCIMGHRLVDL
jgi:hypothetical protein